MKTIKEWYNSLYIETGEWKSEIYCSCGSFITSEDIGKEDWKEFHYQNCYVKTYSPQEELRSLLNDINTAKKAVELSRKQLDKAEEAMLKFLGYNYGRIS